MEIKYGDIKESGADLILLIAEHRYYEGILVPKTGILKRLCDGNLKLAEILGQRLREAGEDTLLYIPHEWPEKSLGLLMGVSHDAIMEVFLFMDNNTDISVAIEYTVKLQENIHSMCVETPPPDGLTLWSDKQMPKLPEVNEDHWLYPLLVSDDSVIKALVGNGVEEDKARESFNIMYDGEADEPYGRMVQALTCDSYINFRRGGLPEREAKTNAIHCGRNRARQIAPF